MPGAVATPPAREQTEGSWPSVTVVVVNFNGRDYLDRCLASLRAQRYPADEVEVILIDNASTDGSVAHVRSAYPEVQVVVNDTNTGFSPAVNQGARLANGTYLALINNDAEADEEWLRRAVHVMEAERAVACVASKILREDRETIDYAGGQLSFYGHGFPRGVEHPDAPEGSLRDTLFASGGAMVVRTSVFLDAGGFDESYFAFFEDVDFGWRLWVLGHVVRYVPSSKVYHRHHGTIERFGYARERYLLERNALATIFKNYADDRLAKVLPAALVLSVFRGLDLDGVELPDYRITEDATPLEDLTLPAETGAHLAAVRDFALMLDELRIKRELVQSRRVASDRAVLKLFEESLRPNVFREEFLEAFGQVVRGFGLDDALRSRSRVLVVTQERIASDMTRSAARCWEMVRVLAHEHEVTLASTEPVELSEPSFSTVQITGPIEGLLSSAELVICDGLLFDRFPRIAGCDLPVVVDLAEPAHLEGLSRLSARGPNERRDASRADIESLNRHLRRADFMVCASEKQRDFWLGQLASLERVNPATFDADSSLRALLEVAAHGVPRDAPEQRQPALRGVVEGIGPDDTIVLWSGGLTEWSDPATAVAAVARVARERPEVRLVVLGAAGGPAADRARRTATELGVLGTIVHLIDDDPPYGRRADYLREADLAVSAGLARVETAFSHRPEVLDALWGRLPLVVTDGDAAARLVEDEELGLTVPAEDIDALAAALEHLLADESHREACAKAIGELLPELTWDRTMAPVLDFCRQPHRAPDKVGQSALYVARRNVVVTRSPLYYATRFVEYVRAVGPQTALLHVRNFVRQRLGR
jgi:GT2 family glycosyltransferase